MEVDSLGFGVLEHSPNDVSHTPCDLEVFDQEGCTWITGDDKMVQTPHCHPLRIAASQNPVFPDFGLAILLFCTSHSGTEMELKICC